MLNKTENKCFLKAKSSAYNYNFPANYIIQQAYFFGDFILNNY